MGLVLNRCLQQSNTYVNLYLVQILAGNARKVSAVRFERINNDETMMGTKEVTRLFPKIMKRKVGGDEDTDGTEYDDDAFPREPEDDGHSIQHEDES
jgi:hypothetical protein